MDTRRFVLFYLLTVLLSFCASKSTKTADNVKQGLSGTVKELSEDQMPSPDRDPFEGKALKTTVYIYEPTHISQVERIGSSPFYKTIKSKLIDSIVTDKKGYFQFKLPQGTYSAFVRVNGRFYSNNFDQKNNISPVTIYKDSVSQLNITVSSTAVF